MHYLVVLETALAGLYEPQVLIVVVGGADEVFHLAVGYDEWGVAVVDAYLEVVVIVCDVGV